MLERKLIELITPCHNEKDCIRPFYEEVKRVFNNEIPDYDYIITYVDDGSYDNTLSVIRELAKEVENVRYISLSRNFGKEAAMYAGLAKCVGDYVVMLDSDLQHPPALIPKMLKAVVEEGYDCATARRISRKGEPPIRSFLSRSFYHVFNRVTSINLVSGSTDFRFMTRQVAKAVMALPETERFTKGIYSWIGFQNKWIEYVNVERAAGKTKWSIRGLARYSINGFFAFATTPLRIATYLGMLICLVDLIYIIKLIPEAVTYGRLPGGTGTTQLLLTAGLGGLIIFILGIIGEYMARIYLEVKRRPVYLIRETNIEDKNSDV
ncbi:MAG: glycosyltransferase family 2 protein [Bacteroidaceae bacterium]|nr:glycosyltransferase family 2 protein [Bacteroidaceae bacterium]